MVRKKPITQKEANEIAQKLRAAIQKILGEYFGEDAKFKEAPYAAYRSDYEGFEMTVLIEYLREKQEHNLV